MEIIKCKYRINCEMGGCNKRADYTVLPNKYGVRGCLHICKSCLEQITSLANSLQENPSPSTKTANTDCDSLAKGAARATRKAKKKNTPSATAASTEEVNSEVCDG